MRKTIRDCTQMLGAIALLLCLAFLAESSPVQAMPEIPALTKISPNIAKLFPELVAERQRLIAELDQLRPQFDAQTAACKAVPASDTAKVEWCRTESVRLHKLLAKNIKARTAFNNDLRLSIKIKSDSISSEGWALLRKKDYSGAIKKFNMAYSLTPEDRRTDANLSIAEGLLALENGDIELATKKYWCAVTSDPSAAADYLLGSLKGKLKRMNKKFEVRTPTACLAVRS